VLSILSEYGIVCILRGIAEPHTTEESVAREISPFALGSESHPARWG
jgi:hypothetical protein